MFHKIGFEEVTRVPTILHIIPRIEARSVEVEGVGECLNRQSLGFLGLIAQSFLKDENLN